MSTSTTFIASSTGSLFKRTGFDESGRPNNDAPVLIRYTPIKIVYGHEPTSIRTDKSGTKSRADHTVELSKILVHPRIGKPIDIGDLIEIIGRKFEVISVQPRLDMDGRMHHYEVSMS